MQAKRLVFPSKHRVETETVDIPDEPGQGQVLVENLYGLISPGTELAMYTETHVGFGRADFSYAKYPFRPGYAAVGKALKIGPGVTNISIGQTVISRSQHVSHAVIAARPVADGMDPKLAPFTYLAEIAFTAVVASDVKVGMDVAVFGQGLIGNLAAQWMNVAGARQVIGVDPIQERIEIAKKCDISSLLNPKTSDVEHEIKKLTDGNGCHVVIEATGNPAVAGTAMKAVGMLGKVILLGSPRGAAQMELYWDIHRPGVSIIGAHERHREAFSYNGVGNTSDLSLEFIRKGRLKVSSFITQIIDASHAEIGYNGLLNDPAKHLGVLMKLQQWN